MEMMELHTPQEQFMEMIIPLLMFWRMIFNQTLWQVQSDTVFQMYSSLNILPMEAQCFGEHLLEVEIIPKELKQFIV